jgi:hypothetical protein
MYKYPVFTCITKRLFDVHKRVSTLGFIVLISNLRVLGPDLHGEDVCVGLALGDGASLVPHETAGAGCWPGHLL